MAAVELLMRLLIATSQYAGLVTLGPKGAHVERFHEGAGCYMGVTWDAHRVYVMALENEGWWAGHGGVGSGKERLLVFNARCELVDTIPLPTVDAHGIHYDAFAERVLIADRGRRCLTTPRERVPVAGVGPSDPHINWVWVDQQGRVWVLWRYYSPQCSMLRRFGEASGGYALGCEAHTAYIRGGRAVRCDSADGWLSVGDSALDLDAGYPRGIADVGGTLYVGGSARGDRSVRHYGTAQIIKVRSRRGRLKVGRRWALPNAGQIYTVRAVDYTDWAHHGTWGPRCPIGRNGT